MVNQTLTTRIAAVALTAVLLLTAAACSSNDDPPAPPSTTARPGDDGTTARQPALDGPVAVFAAEPLAEVLPLLVERFKIVNPAVEVTLRFDSTPVLTMELLDGAAADVFIAADEANMQTVADGGRTDGTPKVMALARLVIVTAPGNPSGLASLADLAGAGSVAICSADTPCGVLTDEVLAAADISLSESRRTASGADSIDALVAGEVDAAIVFAADARAAGGEVEVVDLSDEVVITGRYTIATLLPADNGLAARAFVDFVLSDEGAEVLSRYGFAQQ